MPLPHLFRRMAWRLRLPVHPPREVLERFVRGDLPAGDFSRVFQHLLPGCGRCRAFTAPLWNIGAPPPEGYPAEYEQMFERVFSNVRRVAGEREAGSGRKEEGSEDQE